MSERIHLQHLHSTTATTVNSTVKADLLDGEIAILMKDGSEKIAFRNSADEVVYVSTDEANGNSYAAKSHSHNASDISGGTLNIGRIPTGKTSTTVALGDHQHKIKINGTSKTISADTEVDFGNVETYKGTLTGITVTAGNGLVSGGTISGSTGSKGGTITLAVGAGTGITVDANAVSISSDYQKKITSGTTAYEWGNHADAGYATNSALNTHITVKGTVAPAGGTPTLGHVALISGDVKEEVYADGLAAAASHTHSQYANKTDFINHTGNTTAHITATERTNWNNTKTRLDTFLSGATLSGNVIDTLTEIQNYITDDAADAAKIISDISTISGNLTSHTTTSASTSNLGHVKIVGGDLSGKTGSVVTGEAAASQHTHSQYQPKGDYLTSYTEKYKGTVTGVTVTGSDGLSGTGTISASSGNTGGTITIKHGSPITNSGTTNVDFSVKSNAPTVQFGGAINTLSALQYDKNGHIISAATSTLLLPTLPEATNDGKGVVKLNNGVLTIMDSLLGTSNGVAAGAGHTHEQYLTSVTVDNHYTPTSSTTKSVGATEIITGISMDAKGHVTGVNKGSYTIATSVPSNAVFTDTHHTGTTVVTNSSTGKTTASTIADGSVRLNHIENNAVKSSILLNSDDFCDVKGTAANQITFSINTGTTSSTVARGDHSHDAYVNKNAFGNVKIGSTTIAAETTQDTLELVAGESISLTPDATNDKITIAVTSIDCGTF